MPLKLQDIIITFLTSILHAKFKGNLTLTKIKVLHYVNICHSQHIIIVSLCG